MVFACQSLLSADKLTKAIQVFSGKLRIQILLIKGFYEIMILSKVVILQDIMEKKMLNLYK